MYADLLDSGSGVTATRTPARSSNRVASTRVEKDRKTCLHQQKPKDFRKEIVNFIVARRAQEQWPEIPPWLSYEKACAWFIRERRCFSKHRKILLPVISFNAKRPRKEDQKETRRTSSAHWGNAVITEKQVASGISEMYLAPAVSPVGQRLAWAARAAKASHLPEKMRQTLNLITTGQLQKLGV